MTHAADSVDVFLFQAGIARQMGSEFMARLFEATSRQLHVAPGTAQMIAEWPGDPRADNVALRLGGGLHALARKQATTGLAALYRNLDGDFDQVVAEVMRQEDVAIAEWLRSTPQTNEVGRSAAIWAALLVAATRHPPTFELLELGSSAGLNLNLDLYGYELGGQRSGDPRSPVVLKPEWRGAPPPPPASINIRGARGVDLAPLDVRDAAARDGGAASGGRDAPARAAGGARARASAAGHPPAVDHGDAAAWIVNQLAVAQDQLVTRVVFHSIVLQFLSDAARTEVTEAIKAAGHRATAERPLVWIVFEWDPARKAAVLSLTSWPDGVSHELATCQVHGGWIDWAGAP